MGNEIIPVILSKAMKTFPKFELSETR
jgi:hypothetical protein